jgi:rhamnogalacturonan acetylesterase
MKTIKILLIVALVSLAFTQVQHQPVLYIIGDSTVKNGDGTGRNGQVGWGSVISVHFDSSKISVQNQAIGGRSSRTFITDGRWDKILANLQAGDFVIMQFGHNDSGKLDDTARARGTIPGVGDDSVEIYNPIRKMKEVVHSYGWYMRKYANEARAKGAVAIICSPIPRADWKDGKIAPTQYTGWAKQAADATGAYFIDLNDRISTEYNKMDTASVRKFFPADHTHTNYDGAVLNAKKVVEGIKDLQKCELKKYLN